jgi:hypothetical protein
MGTTADNHHSDDFVIRPNRTPAIIYTILIVLSLVGYCSIIALVYGTDDINDVAKVTAFIPIGQVYWCFALSLTAGTVGVIGFLGAVTQSIILLGILINKMET